MSTNKDKLQIVLSESELADLEVFAKYHGTNRATVARRVVQAWITDPSQRDFVKEIRGSQDAADKS